MSIQFACERCGHAIEVDDRFAGLAGHCKHCGAPTSVPPAPAGPDPLRLRAIATGDAPDPDDPRVGARPALQVRPLAPHDGPGPAPLDLDEPPDPKTKRARGKPPYVVLDPDHREKTQASRFWLNPHYETRAARALARLLRWTRDWLYVASIGCLIAVLWGYQLGNKRLLHLGTVGVVATNVGMLAVGLFYLVVLPFRDSLAKGLGTLLFPPYAVYYWATHWPQMRTPVVKTLRSFTPILLAGLAVFFYKEAPVVEKAAERAIDKVEGFLQDDPEPAADSTPKPQGRGRRGPPPARAPEPTDGTGP